MFRRAVLPAALLALAYALWVGADYIEIAAGVALFLFGMTCLEEGFKTFTGGALENILRRSTNRLWKSLLFGAGSTTVMQSSTLVSLITISFVSAQMITLAAGIGVIMGANIGTTTGAWLIAGLGLQVNISSYAMPMLVFGVVLTMQRSQAVKGAGYLLLGAGFLFLGIHYMKEGFDAFQGNIDLAAYSVSGYLGVLLFVMIGVLLTVVMQSSHATLLIIITALAASQVTYDNALAMAIGANLGSAITTALGGLAANLGGRRLAAGHVIFNLVTASVAVIFISQLAWLVEVLAGGIGIGQDDYLLKLALFHTVFNTLGVLLLAPFIKQLEAVLMKWIVQKPTSSEQPLYLYPEALETSQTAVSAVRSEVLHLMDNAFGLLSQGLSLNQDIIEGEASLEQAVKNTQKLQPLNIDQAYEEKIKSLHSEIVAFIAHARGHELTPGATAELYALRQASRNVVEAVKGMKHLHKNLSQHGLSQQSAVRERYDLIRLQLATMLRDLRQLLGEERDEVSALSVDAIRLSLQRANRRMIDELDELIRHRRIPATIATSVMNDETYAADIGHSLLDAAAVLLANSPDDATEALELDEYEISEMANSTTHHESEAGEPR